MSSADRVNNEIGLCSVTAAVLHQTVARNRSRDEEQEDAVAGARVAFAFSQDRAASGHEIRMILQNR